MKTWRWQVSELLVAVTVMAAWCGCSSQPSSAGATINSNTVPEAATEKEPLQKIAPVPLVVSPAIQEIAKLAQAGVSEDVILAFVDQSAADFNPSVDEILYLNDLGVSARVISRMVSHGQDLRNQAPVQAASAEEMAGIAAVPAPTAETAGATMVSPSPVASPPPQPEPQPQAPAPVVQAAPEVVPPPPVETVVSVPSPPVYAALPPQVNVFYSSLAPYGSWVELDNYGWCWQPTTVMVNPSWMPYGDRGRWLYTDCGWYWQSDYSWGWAPFHYGRWLRHHRCGWVWAPDDVWAPAWVSWRRSPLYCGWAPLPPGAHYRPGLGFSYFNASVSDNFGFGLSVYDYAFVPWRHFNNHNPHGHYLPPTQVINIYNKTTVVNRYVTGPNQVVVNEGVGTDHVASLNSKKLQPIRVLDSNPSSGQAGRPDRLERSGNSMVLYRPQLAAGALPKPALQNARGAQELSGGSLTARPTGGPPGASPRVRDENLGPRNAERGATARGRELLAERTVPNPSTVVPRSPSPVGLPNPPTAPRTTTSPTLPVNRSEHNPAATASALPNRPQPADPFASRPITGRSELPRQSTPVLTPSAAPTTAIPRVSSGAARMPMYNPSPMPAQPMVSPPNPATGRSQPMTRPELTRPSTPIQPAVRPDSYPQRTLSVPSPSAPVASPYRSITPSPRTASPVWTAPMAPPVNQRSYAPSTPAYQPSYRSQPAASPSYQSPPARVQAAPAPIARPAPAPSSSGSSSSGNSQKEIRR